MLQLDQTILVADVVVVVVNHSLCLTTNASVVVIDYEYCNEIQYIPRQNKQTTVATVASEAVPGIEVVPFPGNMCCTPRYHEMWCETGVNKK